MADCDNDQECEKIVPTPIKPEPLPKQCSGGGESGEGTNDFNELENRPKYGGRAMTGDTNIPEVETYEDFVGTDGEESGTAGLVPAPEATDVDKFLKSDGTWAEAGGGSGINVVQTTGTSPDDVMSQDAVSSMVFADPATREKIKIGAGASTSAHSYNMAIGRNSKANAAECVAIGNSSVVAGANGTAVGASTNVSGSNSTAVGSSARARSERSVALGAGATVEDSPAMAYSVALGANSVTTRAGEVNVGTGVSNLGYSSTPYRVIGGVHDPVDAHDAATKGYVDANAGGGDTVYSDKSTSDASDGGAVFIGPLNASQTPLPDPTTTDKHYRYFWAMPFDVTGQDNFGIPGSESINIGGQQNSASNNTTIGYRTKVLSGDTNTVLGYQAEAKGYSSNVVIGDSATSTAGSAVVIGRRAQTSFNGTVALGSYSQPTRMGEVNVGTSQSGYGYNNTNYRVIGGVHDGIDDHDAATVGQIHYRQRKPVVVWEVDGEVVTTGLVAVGEDISANPNWQLTDLDLTPYKRIKIFTKAAQKAGTTASASTTPAMVLEMSLDPRAAIAEYGGNYVGSMLAQKPNDANRLCTLTCAVSADKTKFEVLRMTNLYGTAATSNSDVNAYVFKIEGYYD